MTNLSVLMVGLATIANLGHSDETLPIAPRETEVLTIMPREFKGDPAKLESPSIIRGGVRSYGTYEAPFGRKESEVTGRQRHFLETLNRFKNFDLNGDRETRETVNGPEILTIVPRLVK
jgi:hypothetical protein